MINSLNGFSLDTKDIRDSYWPRPAFTESAARGCIRLLCDEVDAARALVAEKDLRIGELTETATRYATHVKALETLLQEWQETEFFEDRADWLKWVDSFGSRVKVVLR